jgi:hypothetical protein
MCTVTLIPCSNGREDILRIACNRDESRSRPRAFPPELRIFGDRRAVLPIDPASGGSWIAVNDAGLAMVILNRNSSDMPVNPAPLSRGAILPHLLHCDSLRSSEQLALDLNGYCFAPFRLILINRTEGSVIDGGGSALPATQHLGISRPLMFTSSGLGDAIVEGPRRRLFGEMFPEPRWCPEQQDLFHRHSWPSANHLSVCMRRADARTVSHTVVELGRETAVMTYSPHPPDEPGPSVAMTLPLETKVSA